MIIIIRCKWPLGWFLHWNISFKCGNNPQIKKISWFKKNKRSLATNGLNLFMEGYSSLEDRCQTSIYLGV